MSFIQGIISTLLLHYRNFFLHFTRLSARYDDVFFTLDTFVVRRRRFPQRLSPSSQRWHRSDNENVLPIWAERHYTIVEMSHSLGFWILATKRRDWEDDVDVFGEERIRGIENSITANWSFFMIILRKSRKEELTQLFIFIPKSSTRQSDDVEFWIFPFSLPAQKRGESLVQWRKAVDKITFNRE